MSKLKLSEYTSLGMGGEANARIITNVAHLTYSGETVFGRGTNVLVSDKVHDDILIMRNVGIEIHGSTVEVQSGTPLARLANVCASAGLSGLEWACGIPGSVGGAIVMNAGAFGGEIADVLQSATILTAHGKVTLKASELGFEYRCAKRLPRGVIISAVFSFGVASESDIRALMSEHKARRRALQPIGRTFGSAFKRVDGVGAGYYIDRAGLKGYRVGCARISDKHANFVIADGDDSRDVFDLLASVKLKVYKVFGVRLTEEVKYVGDF